jgi:hypothetical protein
MRPRPCPLSLRRQKYARQSRSRRPWPSQEGYDLTWSSECDAFRSTFDSLFPHSVHVFLLPVHRNIPLSLDPILQYKSLAMRYPSTAAQLMNFKNLPSHNRTHRTLARISAGRNVAESFDFSQISSGCWRRFRRMGIVRKTWVSSRFHPVRIRLPNWDRFLILV